MKNKNKLIILILCIVFIIFLIVVYRPYEYQYEYFINNYKIQEKYNTKGYYTFTITNAKEKYVYLIKNKYTRERELIQKIQVAKNDKEICILPESQKVELYPLCNKNNLIYTYNNSDNKDLGYKYHIVENKKYKYKNMEITNLNGYSFLIYNYKGFYIINEKKKKEIKLFDKDIYKLPLVYQYENYVILPDYNQSYYFNKIFIINILNGKKKEITFDYNISYEAEFLGHYKKNIYLLDKKEEKEYKININKNKIEKIDYQVLKDKKLVKTDFKKVKPFVYENVFKYELIDNKIYQIINDSKIKISDLYINHIIKIYEDNVYYLSNENLYMFNNKDGEVLLMSNFEWNFNNTNMIYIYK